jgi:hypothetical protein
MGMPAAIKDLAGKVVNGDPGNSLYQFVDSSGAVKTVPLSNLTASSNSGQLTDLVKKWFRGINDPVADSGAVYRPADPSIPLVDGGFNYYDVNQNNEGDCWLISSLAEVAARKPSVLKNMFTYEGMGDDVAGNQVGIYAVRFYDNFVPYYVTVNTDLPKGGNGYYASVSHDIPNSGDTSEELWVALAEKAYAQANGSGAVISSNNYTDSYAALNSGWPSWALYGITGTSAVHATYSPSSLAAAWNKGQYVVLCTPDDPADSGIVGEHCYAMIGYYPTSPDPFQLFNPWGIKGSVKTYSQADLFFASAADVNADFSSEVVAGSGMNGQNGQAAANSAENTILATDSELLGKRLSHANGRQVVNSVEALHPNGSPWALFLGGQTPG